MTYRITGYSFLVVAYSKDGFPFRYRVNVMAKRTNPLDGTRLWDNS